MHVCINIFVAGRAMSMHVIGVSDTILIRGRYCSSDATSVLSGAISPDT